MAAARAVILSSNGRRRHNYPGGKAGPQFSGPGGNIGACSGRHNWQPWGAPATPKTAVKNRLIGQIVLARGNLTCPLQIFMSLAVEFKTRPDPPAILATHICVLREITTRCTFHHQPSLAKSLLPTSAIVGSKIPFRQAKRVEPLTGFVVGIGIGVAKSGATGLLTTAGKAALQKWLGQSAADKATQATADAFPEFEGLVDALREWRQTDEFTDLLARFLAGERAVVDETAVEVFVRRSSFFDAEQTPAKAREVLATFFDHLATAAYSEPQGLAVFANRVETQHEETRAQLDLIQAGIDELRQQVPQTAPIQESTVARSPKEQAFHARIDAARDLLQAGKPSAARLLLNAVREAESAEAFSPELHYRLATNLGACALQFGELDNVYAEMQVALRFKPGDSVALTNAAVGALLTRRYQEALELSTRSRQTDATNPEATATYIDALHRSGCDDDLNEFVQQNPWVEGVAQTALSLGEAHLDAQQYDDAVRLLRVAATSIADDPQPHAQLAVALMSKVQRATAGNPPLQSRLPQEIRDEVAEADRELSTAVDILSTHEHRAHLIPILATRAGIRAMQQRFEEAEADCAAVLDIDPNTPVALRNQGLLALVRGRPLDALRIFERLGPGEDREAVQPAVAEALLQLQRYREAATLAEARWSDQLPDWEKFQLADFLIRAYVGLQQLAKAEDILGRLANLPDQIEVAAVRAMYLAEVDRLDEAAEVAEAARAAATGHQRDRLTLLLSQIHVRRRDYAAAAALYSDIADTSADTPGLRQYAAVLFQAGDYTRALEITRRLRGDGEPIPGVSEIEAYVLEFQGNLRAAKTLWEQMADGQRGRPEHFIQAAIAALRLGDEDAARRLIARVEYSSIRQNAYDLVRAGQLRLLLGMDGALPLIYAARQVDFNDPDMHMAYVSAALRLEAMGKFPATPDQADVDTTVLLRRDDTVKAFTIAENGARLDRNELNADDALAQRLRGVSVGDQVHIGEEQFEEPPYQVVGVLSKYAYAAQQTFAEFTTWFPHSESMRVLRVSEEHHEGLLRTLDARQRAVLSIIGLHQAGLLSMSAAAGLLGCSTMSLWRGLASEPDQRILVSRGEQLDRDAQLEAIGSANQIAIDVTALCTLVYLGLEDRLDALNIEVLIAQPALDEVNRDRAETALDGATAGAMWKQGEQYFLQEYAPNALAERREFIEKLQRFMVGRTVPVEAALDVGRDRFNQLGRLIGRSSVAAVLVAKDRTTALYADDLALRGLATVEWQVESVTTQTILMRLRDAGIVSPDEYHEAIGKLARAGYQFLSVSADDLLWHLRRDGLAISAEAMALFRTLHGPECELESAARLLAQVVRAVWTETWLPQRQIGVLDAALRALCHGRSSRVALASFDSALRPLFNLIPFKLSEVQQNVRIWATQHVIA